VKVISPSYGIARLAGLILGQTSPPLSETIAPARGQTVETCAARSKSLTNPEIIDLKKFIVKLSIRQRVCHENYVFF